MKHFLFTVFFKFEQGEIDIVSAVVSFLSYRWSLKTQRQPFQNLGVEGKLQHRIDTHNIMYVCIFNTYIYI